MKEYLTSPLGRIDVEASPQVPDGIWVLWRKGKVVWTGQLGAPIEDIDFDKATMSTADFMRMRKLAADRGYT